MDGLATLQPAGGASAPLRAASQTFATAPQPIHNSSNNAQQLPQLEQQQQLQSGAPPQDACVSQQQTQKQPQPQPQSHPSKCISTISPIRPTASDPAQGENSLSSSPRQFPTGLTSSILEEEDESSESDTPNEPVTPVSGRQSQDFHSLQNHDTHPTSLSSSAEHSTGAFSSLQNDAAPTNKTPLILGTSATPDRPEPAPSEHSPTSTKTVRSPTAPSDTEASTSATKTITLSHPADSLEKKLPQPPPAHEPGFPTIQLPNRKAQHRAAGSGLHQLGVCDIRWAAEASATKSPVVNKEGRHFTSYDPFKQPPSPPINMLAPSERAATSLLPSPSHEHVDFGVIKKKVRSSTGLGGLGRKAAQFVTSGGKTSQAHQPNGDAKQPQRMKPQRRASSFDLKKAQADQTQRVQNGDMESLEELTRQPWGMPAMTGVGLKARRLSVSLPDDFTVDVADLLAEFEYYHKVLGRHGKHLGKGATSKVTLMQRKSCPEELYAVKEFRPKSSTETKDEYEQKIKSEFSIAKSLHHPNIVESIRLCTDHGRWNHVMEYCSEGDLYSLVEKKYLLEESRKVDRLCLFKQLVQGINYLHTNGIAHRDIKLENLLITKDSKLKITDFGVSDVFTGTHPGLREAGGQCGINMGEVRLCDPGICGSLPYISPEVLTRGVKYDPRALDVWGAGVIAINLFFGAPLWKEARDDGANPQYTQLVRAWTRWEKKHGNDMLGEGEEGVPAICDGDQPYTAAFDMGIKPPALRRLVFGMLHPNPARRIGISQVLNNRWMKTVECCQFESYDEPSTKIDASKKECFTNKKIFCHNHLPPVASGNHSLGKMPGQAGY
ncbi:serine/threonine-protein kinase hal4 [Pyricularia oryzae Y34]|uniref:Serine/threonine-protein kinase hal4 n=1 Tax=Pyricularia oryzae (strain Y34) TaxID=1143189 RepID=A0AA97PJD1_PYRO3|nr:serine/threonine-protein kinase hal4 [Pyricularia oryzae Y34]